MTNVEQWPVCASCGATAVPGRPACDVCTAPLAGRVLAAPRLDHELLWVQVRARFQCRACGYHSPLNHLDVDGAFLCHHCQLDQAADPEAWRAGESLRGGRRESGASPVSALWPLARCAAARRRRIADPVSWLSRQRQLRRRPTCVWAVCGVGRRRGARVACRSCHGAHG